MPRVWLVLGLVTACPMAPESSVAPPPVVERWAPEAPPSQLETLTVAAPRVTATRTEEGWRVEPSLVLRHDRRLVFAGLGTEVRGVLVPHSGFVLQGGGLQVAAQPAGPGDPGAAGAVLVPGDGARRREHTPVFLWPGNPLPDDLVLRYVAEQETGEVLLRGRWRDEAGQAATAIVPVDLGGRLVLAPGRVEGPAIPVERRKEGVPFLVPADAGPVTLVLEGYEPVALELHAEDAATLEVTVLPTASPEVALESALAATWPAPSAPLVQDLAELAITLRTPEAAVAWVREHVSVRPTSSLRLGPEAAARAGAGGPQERALVARDLLARLGLQSDFVCGDLPLAEARSTYTVRAPPPAAAPLSTWIAAAATSRDALAPRLAGALSDWATRPLPVRHRFALVPEWCWVDAGVSPDEAWTRHDLRPDPIVSPIPFPWRSTAKVKPDTWRVMFLLEAHSQGPEGWRSVRVAEAAPTSIDLSERALLFDLYPGSAARTYGSQQSTVYTEMMAGERGPEVELSELRQISLTITLKDPDSVGSRSQVIELWQYEGAPPPRSIRVFASMDTGARTLDHVAQRLAFAVRGRAPDPGVAALWARHDLYTVVRDQLLGGEAAAEPTILLTVLEDLGDEAPAWRMEAWPPPSPVSLEAPPSDDAIARFAAADAAARALVLDPAASLPDPPTRWLDTAADLATWSGPSTRVQMGVARGLDRVDYGVGEAGALWIRDPASGGVTWHQPVAWVRPSVPPSMAGVPPGDPEWPSHRWDLPVRCHEALRWAAWRGMEAPAACAPPQASTDETVVSPGR